MGKKKKWQAWYDIWIFMFRNSILTTFLKSPVHENISQISSRKPQKRKIH